MTNSTTSDILLENATQYANMPALSSKDKSGNWNTTTWSEFSGETMDVAKSLTALGFQKGDKLVLGTKQIDSAIKDLDQEKKHLLKARDQGGVVAVEADGVLITAYQFDSYKKY